MSGKSKTIDAASLSAYERYELPLVGKQGGSGRANKQIKLPTAEDIEAIQNQAREAGYEAGFKQGMQDGLEKGKAQGEAEGRKLGTEQGLQEGLQQAKVQVDQAVSQLGNMMSELVAPLKQSEEQLEQALLNTVLAVSRAVIIRELETDINYISKVVHTALGHLSKVHHDSICLKVNAGDIEYVRDALSDFDTPVAVEVAPDILPGGCIVQTDKQVVDYTLEKRFQKTVQGLLAAAVTNEDVAHASEGPDRLEDMADLHRDVLEENQEPRQAGSVNSEAEIVPDSSAHERHGQKSSADDSEVVNQKKDHSSQAVSADDKAAKLSEANQAVKGTSASTDAQNPASDEDDFDDESPF